MQRFKSWDEIEPTATKAERKLKQAAEAGEFCICGPKGQTPPEPADWSSLPADRRIRADVLRFFLLGGCADSLVTEVGVMLTGALISGELDLADCEIPGNMLVHNCRFQHGIHATRCNALKNFRLESCKLPFLSAAGLKVGEQLDCEGAEFQSQGGIALNLQGAKIDQNVFLGSARILGEANLNGLQTDGQLGCTSATFRNQGRSALSVQGAKIGQDVFLNSAKVLGKADLNGIHIGGQLGCDDTEFQCPGRIALNLQDAVIGHGLFFRHQVKIKGAVDLRAARCGVMVDDPDCWPERGQLILDGFSYGRIIGSTDAQTRLTWLARSDNQSREFFPQPYKQLAKVLHDAGHEADAKTIRVALAQKLAFEARRLRRIELDGNWGPAWASIWYDITRPVLWLIHQVLNILTSHGFRPERSLFALVLLWLLAVLPAHLAWKEGSFAPNSSIILTSEEWAEYDTRNGPPDVENPAQDWSDNTVAGRDWESFHPLAYAADVVIPIINFGQTDAWAPSTTRGPAGVFLWWARWLFTLAGWIVTALGAAALTGIIRRE
ncbi:hypothetical protein RA24_01975 [Leisingera sp. ANG-M6]|nr:hypothetical protein RA24_01975 [Leisingera sp. ANG-M6]